MAKNNNLTDFLTGVADAIRTKKGTTDLINPQNFESEILSIETGGGGTSAVLGELNVSSNGTYEAGSTVTLVPGGLYQYKSVLPKETLAELYAATEANGGVLFNIFNSSTGEADPITQVKIQKINEEYVLVSESFKGEFNTVYATGSVEIPSGGAAISLNAGWSALAGDIYSMSTSKVRLPQSLDGIPGKFASLLEFAFDANNEVNLPIDETSAITIENLGTFGKISSSIGPAEKKLTISSMGGFNELSNNISSQSDMFAVLYSILLRNLVMSTPQTDIEGLKYFKTEPNFPMEGIDGQAVKVALVYIEDPSKVQVTAGTAEAGCWYFIAGLYFGPTMTWSIVYEKELVDGYNKVTVNVPAQAKLQSKTATINGVYSPDEGFDGLSQVTVNFALQNKTITANGTYTCDEGYGGLGQVEVSIDSARLQNKTITENGTYTADSGYDGLNRVTVKIESRTLLDNGKLAVHTVAGADDLSLDPNKVTVEELIVNEGATSISKGTEYTSLKRVVLPDTLETIASGTFSKCANLESMVIPFVGMEAGKTASDTYQYPFGYIFGTSNYTGGTGTEQYYYAGSTTNTTRSYFYIPSSLKSVTVTGGNILHNAFQNCSGLTSITIGDGVTSIGSGAFSGCSGLTNISIGNGVTSIGHDAFYGCSSLTNVTIPDSVTSIGSFVFQNCSGLTSITLPDSITDIDGFAFDNCSGLTSVTIPSGVTSIGSGAFRGCSGLTGVYISDLSAWCKIQFKSGEANPLYYAKNLYLNNELVRDLVIPDNVTSVGDYAFNNCSGLTSVTIPDSVTSIGSSAFYGDVALTGLTIPGNVETVGSYAFRNCSGLTSITIGNGMTSIENGVFQGCSSLTGITIPNNMTSIGNWAFSGCSNLTTVSVLATTPPTLKSTAFENTALTQIIVPAGCGEAYKTAANWSAYADYIIEEGMHRITLGENVTCSVGDTSYSNQTFDVADQTVIHFEVGQASEGGAVSSTHDGIFLNGTLVSDNSGPATYDLTVTGNVSVTYSAGDVVGDITYNNCYKIVMN